MESDGPLQDIITGLRLKSGTILTGQWMPAPWPLGFSCRNGGQSLSRFGPRVMVGLIITHHHLVYSTGVMGLPPHLLGDIGSILAARWHLQPAAALASLPIGARFIIIRKNYAGRYGGSFQKAWHSDNSSPPFSIILSHYRESVSVSRLVRYLLALPSLALFGMTVLCFADRGVSLLDEASQHPHHTVKEAGILAWK